MSWMGWGGVGWGLEEAASPAMGRSLAQIPGQGWGSLLCSQWRPVKPVRQVHFPVMWSQLAPF